jgi:sugar phosphate isomerase/epimerase
MDSRYVERDVLEGKTRLLDEAVAYGMKKRVYLGIENLSEKASDFGPLVEAIPDLRITLDIGHAQLLSKRNRSFELIEELGSRISHIHIHDNRGGKRGPADDLHLPIGEGVIDFESILRALLDTGYDGTMTLELEKDVLVSSRERIKNIIGSL